MYKVEYTVQGHENVFYAGPYETYTLALEHKADIEGFEGVENVSIVPAFFEKEALGL